MISLRVYARSAPLKIFRLKPERTVLSSSFSFIDQNEIHSSIGVPKEKESVSKNTGGENKHITDPQRNGGRPWSTPVTCRLWIVSRACWRTVGGGHSESTAETN